MGKITGKIIRIPDTRTILINLGREDGIDNSSIFSIYGKPELITDPETQEELGNIVLIKAKVKAFQVYEKFTIATTKWREHRASIATGTASALASILGESIEVDEGELNVEEEDIQPWRAKTEEFVQVGDIVEVDVTLPDRKQTEMINDNGAEDEKGSKELPPD